MTTHKWRLTDTTKKHNVDNDTESGEYAPDRHMEDFCFISNRNLQKFELGLSCSIITAGKSIKIRRESNCYLQFVRKYQT